MLINGALGKPALKAKWAEMLDEITVPKPRRPHHPNGTVSTMSFPTPSPSPVGLGARDPREWLRRHGFKPGGTLTKDTKTPRKSKHGQNLTYTALFEASAMGQLSVLQFLCDHNALHHIHEKNAEGRTPLFVASQGGYLDVVKWLCSLGSDEDLQAIDIYGYTPESIAHKHGHRLVAAWLRRAKAPDRGVPGTVSAGVLAPPTLHGEMPAEDSHERIKIVKRLSRGNGRLQRAQAKGKE